MSCASLPREPTRTIVYGDSKPSDELHRATITRLALTEHNVRVTLSASPQLAADASILEIDGMLRVPLTADLRQRVEAVLRCGGRRIVLDLSELHGIDAGGIGELIHAYNTTVGRGGVLQIVRANRRVHQLLEIAGLWELLTIDASLNPANSW